MERIKRALELAKAERDSARQSATWTGNMPGVQRVDAADPSSELTGRFLGTRELQVDPRHLKRSRLLNRGMQGPGAQSFKMLRTQVMQRMRAHNWNSLAVCSSTPGDGKTTVAINLAMAISMDAGHSVVLVDFDLRQPAVARRLGITADPGIEACLTGGRHVTEVFVRLAGFERLMILPAGEPVVHSSELLASESTQRLVHELRNRYTDRTVVFDLPPLLGADDALAFMPQVDAVLMVVSEGHTRAEHLARGLELLKDKPIVGTVLNRARSDGSAYFAY